jgi:hypothetical protein
VVKAVWLEEFGGSEVLVTADAPDPVPGPGQALIEVAFANITFVETMFRASGFGLFEKELPMIPGDGVGGGGRRLRRGGRRRRRIRFQAARPWWPNGPFRNGERRMGEDIGRGRRRVRGGVDRPVPVDAGGDAS